MLLLLLPYIVCAKCTFPFTSRRILPADCSFHCLAAQICSFSPLFSSHRITVRVCVHAYVCMLLSLGIASGFSGTLLLVFHILSTKHKYFHFFSLPLYGKKGELCGVVLFHFRRCSFSILLILLLCVKFVTFFFWHEIVLIFFDWHFHSNIYQ